MPHIHVMHPDKYFGDFLCRYLKSRNFEVSYSDSNIECFYSICKNTPDLIVLNKESNFLDIEGFFIKKRNSEKIEDLPIFVVGDFSPKEIVFYKTQNVFAFLSRRINPAALIERLNLYFKLPQVSVEKRTPMLVDMHAKESTLIIQLEGNLEPEKIVILNYKIRRFLQDKKTKTPRIMFIIPSLYPDMITKENVKLLFDFFEFEELKVDPLKIVILTKNKTFLGTVAQIAELKAIKIAQSYYDGFRSITADFDLETKIPIAYLKAGNRFFLDLFDQSNNVRLPAQHLMTDAIIDSLKKEGIRFLKYYGAKETKAAATTPTETQIAKELANLGSGDGDLELLETSDDQVSPIAESPHMIDSFSMLDTTAMEYITRDFHPVSTELFEENLVNEKQNLFFSMEKGQTLLFISLNTSLYELAQQSLSVHFNIQNVQAHENIKPLLESTRYGIVFIDLSIPRDTVIKILHVIRSSATRRKTTIILMATVVNKIDIVIYKKYGTDHIILQPFTTEKFYNKVYQAVTLDRGT